MGGWVGSHDPPSSLGGWPTHKLTWQLTWGQCRKGGTKVAREASEEELHVQRAYGGKNGRPGLVWPERCWWGLAGGSQMTWAPVGLLCP